MIFITMISNNAGGIKPKPDFLCCWGNKNRFSGKQQSFAAKYLTHD